MKRVLLLVLVSALPFCVISCQSEKKDTLKPEYMRHVGDIAKDSMLDASSFVLCNGEERAFQYFHGGGGLKYKGEKSALVQRVTEQFKPIEGNKDTGFVRIRFMVNCKGETGRFRILASDFNYRPKEFDQALVDQLLKVVKELDGWQIFVKNETPLDYYMYLIFKIDNGRIIEILP